MKRLKVLVSAYACRPGEGSEPGVAWNVVDQLVKYHDVWVLTRENNRSAIEAELKRNPRDRLAFIYCEPSRLIQKLNYQQRLVYLHYYLWQIEAYLVARELHKEVGFDLVHHVTYVRYSSPSFLSLLPVPFIWGPVGGGEWAPKTFWQDFNFQGKTYEVFRNLARGLGELDPFVIITARRSVLARATTEDTAERLRKLGAVNVEVFSQLGLSKEEIDQLAKYGLSEPGAVRFISIGRLLHWKGFHLGLRAFAKANLPGDAEYWIVGDGPERERLHELVEELGISHQVKFWNKLSREETLHKLGECVALVHPSLHESGGLVCLEAMAAGRPVICLNLGGPAIQVTEDTGFKISADHPEQVVEELAQAMEKLTNDLELRMGMGRAAQKRVKEAFSWENKVQCLAQLYEGFLSRKNSGVRS